MAEFCTCGAELPPDARFCHKCGKPQREEVTAEPDEVPLPPVRRPREGPPPIDFRNRLAVRVAFMAGLAANLLLLLPYMVMMFPVWFLGAGFAGVRLYVRRSGQMLSVSAGARLGWITGVLSFAIFTVLFTLNFLAAYSSGVFTDRRRLSEVPFFQGNVEQVLEMMRDPAALVVSLMMSIAVLFVLFAGLSMAGGALGARLLRQR